MHVVRALVGVDRLGQASPYPYLFAGMELDSSGLYHTQTRYYSPTFGRFLSADAGLPPNALTYASNDPVNAIDPSGMTAEFVAGAVGMSPAPEGAIGGTGANPESGGLGGAVLAQACPFGDCAIQPQSPNYSQSGLLGLIINFFEDLFGAAANLRSSRQATTATPTTRRCLLSRTRKRTFSNSHPTSNRSLMLSRY
jgi:RHS repeat-associated protein